MARVSNQVMRPLAWLVFVAVATLAPLIGHLPSADAAWAAGGTGLATGAATVMPAGAAPTATADGNVVTVSWPTVNMASGASVAGYLVQRFNASNGASAAVGGTCSGIVATPRCREIVSSGSWFYTVTPVQLTWSGAQSPPGNTLLVP